MNFPFKFESICGNPPYQFNDGGGGFGTSASPAYHMFVEQCKQLNPRYLTLIIPSRWMIGGKSLDTFREEMLYDTHMLKLIDHIDSHDCFPNDIPGGICYFLRDSQYEGYCEVNTVINGKIDKSVRSLREDGIDVFIRYNEAISILHKVLNMSEQSFSNIVSPRHPFGLETDFRGNKTGKYKCYTSKGVRYVDVVDDNGNPVLTKTGKPKTKKVKKPLYYEAGDFRSDMSVELLKQSDIVCTNPPFSFFREYIAQLMSNKKQFLILGNMNAITYKEFFPLLKDNKVWIGCTCGSKEYMTTEKYAKEYPDKVYKNGSNW